MVKTRKTVSVHPLVWGEVEKEADRLRVSHSRITETALIKLLKINENRLRRSAAAKSQPAA